MNNIHGIIGAIIGLALAFGFWRRILSIPNQKYLSKIELISYSRIKTDFPNYRWKAFFYFTYQVLTMFIGFLIFFFWLSNYICMISPCELGAYDRNIIGFLFFQCMIINMAFTNGLYELIFKIHGVNISDYKYHFGYPASQLPMEKYYRYRFGNELRKCGLYRIAVAIAFYTVIQFILIIYLK
jgi:hypothetical protein